MVDRMFEKRTNRRHHRLHGPRRRRRHRRRSLEHVERRRWDADRLFLAEIDEAEARAEKRAEFLSRLAKEMKTTTMLAAAVAMFRPQSFVNRKMRWRTTRVRHSSQSEVCVLEVAEVRDEGPKK